MKSLIDFSTGSISSFGVLISVENHEFIDSVNLDQLFNFLIALVVGVISTIVLNILRAKFPAIFKPINRKKENDTPI